MDAVYHDGLFVRGRELSKEGGIVRVGTPFPRATAMARSEHTRKGTAKVATVTLACLPWYKQAVNAPISLSLHAIVYSQN